MAPKLSFIVSAFDRPIALRCCLAALELQQGGPYEIIVTDNSREVANRHAVDGLVRYELTWHIPPATCYSAANHASKLAAGEWLCFPSDDSYYVPSFARLMLQKALADSLDLVYCDMLDTRLWPEYRHFQTAPGVGSIDKTGFIIKKGLFFQVGGFTNPSHGFSDGHLVAAACRAGAKVGKADGILLVHN